MDRIAAALSQRADTVPEEWKTMRQLAEETDCNANAIKEIVAKLKAMGKVEVATFKLQTKAGVRKIPHYKLNV